MEKDIVKAAIKSLKECRFTCMPILEYRERKYEFSEATHKMVAEEGCSLKWMETLKGGCWHVIPLE